ncbi:L-idonate 5-dehydrogenase [Roseobacter weihaiensis]|uniref:L-idonate 5-dehydrogenase n=1 Tax=Roseobacter weihaiensis TaxID=2763262 RepID=UPI001D0A9B49|nr:L-idonate 5-dehydrogenase [Roseobacter sp. H9]
MTLKACTLYARNDLRVDEIEKPDRQGCEVLVAVSHGGICGSDLHYFQHGGFGPVRVREPLILGHEISGTVLEVPPEAGELAIGDKVAVSPSRPCHTCHHCSREEFQHCENMRFLGSARTFPHVQGGFRSQICVPAEQCHRVGAGTSLAHAACAEPLAVCLHAALQAGDLAGKKVLVTGAGPIGALCVAVAARGGADEIIVTDLFDFTLSKALQMGATGGINVRTSPHDLEKYCAERGLFDVVFECSAAAPAILGAIAAVRPRGTIVQVGVAGSLNLPINAIVGKEITFQGTHRFHPEFAEAVALIDSKAIDVSPILTQTFSVDDAISAFEAATQRESAVKVQLIFNP